jgi:radical SAM protein with 4Fe4S-binding SPASM domain
MKSKIFNKYLIKINKALKNQYSFGLPTNLLIEPTNTCNLKCPGCPTGAGILTRPKGYMSFQNFKKIINEISHSLEMVMLWNYGEPLLNKDIFKMIKYAREKDIRVVTSTNAHFLPGNIDNLINSKISKIIVSLDGASQKTYEKYRQNGNFHKVVQSIEELCQKKDKNLVVELQFIIMRHNEHEAPKIKKLAKKLNVDRLSLKSVWFLDKRLREKYKDLLPQNPKYKRKLEQSGYCIRPWYHMTIQWNGDAAPCCYDANCTINLGNVFKEGVRGIWNGKKFQKFRKIMKRQYHGEKILQICNKCPELSKRRINE